MRGIAKYLLGFLLLKIIKKERISPFIKDIQQEDILKIFNDYGYFESIKVKLPVDKIGGPLPWYTYPAIEYIKQLDLTNKVVFEWGCGNSSVTRN